MQLPASPCWLFHGHICPLTVRTASTWNSSATVKATPEWMVSCRLSAVSFGWLPSETIVFRVPKKPVARCWDQMDH